MRPSQTNYYSGFDPRSIRECRLWIDALDSRTVTTSGTSVISVLDKSSNGYSFTGALGYTYNATKFNGNYPSFYNTASTSRLGSNLTNLVTSPYIVFAVGQNTRTETYERTFFDRGTNGIRLTYRFFSSAYQASMIAPSTLTSTSNSPTFVNCYVISNASQLFVNGTFITSNSIGGLGGANGLMLGRGQASNDAFLGHICEIIAYAGVPFSTNERQMVEGYLAHKWGVASVLPSTHLFRNHPPFQRPIIPPDILTPDCEYWFDGADPRVVASSGTALVTLSNKGGTVGSNLTPSSGTVTTGLVARQNGSNVIGMNSGVGAFTAAFPTQARTRLFALRPTVNTTTTNVTFLSQGSGTTLPGPDIILIDMTNAARPTERTGTGAGSIRMARTGPANQSNIFGIWTVKNSAVTSASNRFALNGTELGAGVTNSIAANYITTSASTTVGSNLDLGEIISMNAELDEVPTRILEGYLAWKWGMQSSLPASHVSRTTRPMGSIFNPRLISNCQFWVDSTDLSTLTLSGGSGVTDWRDKSGNSRTVGGVGPYQLYQTLSPFKYPVVTVNGSTDFIYWNYIQSQPFTIFAVTTQYDPAYYDQSFVFGSTSTTGAIMFYANYNTATLIMNAGSDVDTGVPYVSGRPGLYCGYFSGSTSLFSFNGNVTSNINPGTNALSNIIIGRSSNTEWASAGVGEIIVYNRNLTASERTLVEGYLAWKWNLRNELPNTHPYKNIRP